MSNLTSKPLQNGTVVERGRRSFGVSWRAVGLVALAIGTALWLVGARYTVLGGPQAVNLVLGLFGITLEIALPSGWPFLGLTVIIGSLVSATEFGARPRGRYFARSLLFGLALLLIWLVVNAGDLASTWFGVAALAPDSGELARWVARERIARVLWTAFLTYCPELLILAGSRWLVKGSF